MKYFNKQDKILFVCNWLNEFVKRQEEFTIYNFYDLEFIIKNDLALSEKHELIPITNLRFNRETRTWHFDVIKPK